MHKAASALNLIQSSISSAYGQMYGRDLQGAFGNLAGLIRGNRAAGDRTAPPNDSGG